MIANAADGVPDLPEDGREQEQQQKILNTEYWRHCDIVICHLCQQQHKWRWWYAADCTTIAIFLFSVHYLPAGICVSLLLLSFSVCSCVNYPVHYLSPKRYYAFFLFVTGQWPPPLQKRSVSAAAVVVCRTSSLVNLAFQALLPPPQPQSFSLWECQRRACLLVWLPQIVF